MNEFLPTFLDEAVEILEQWEAACLALDKSPSSEVFDRLFRAAHNLKGSSKSVGLEKYGDFVHRTEDVINLLRSGNLVLSPKIVSLLLEVQTALSKWTDLLRLNPNAVFETGDLLVRLENFSKIQDNSSSDSQFGLFEAQTPLPAKEDTHEVKVETKQEGVEGEKVIANSPQRSDETIRVNLTKLDKVIRLIGELSIQLAILKNSKDTNQIDGKQASDAIALASKGIQDLQSEAMSLRMQTLDSTFQRLERVARDVAEQQNKKIQVVVKGGDVELDKTVIERMKDPLVHLLRNAVDHGVEQPDDRQQLGKPGLATITIEAMYTAANVSIRISDDGSGLNEDKILSIAKARGIVPENAQIDRANVYQLIFVPGFSTAQKVTDVSGRGVGMDVVKRAVEDLNGSILISSEKGRGTTFEVILPSSLSIVDALIVGLGQSLYAVPIQDIEEVVDLSATVVQTTTKRGRVLCHREQVIPLEKLANFLPVEHISLQATKVALVAKASDRTIAFEVDRIEGQQPIVARNLDGGLADLPGFSGGTILANGDPAMILQLPHIVRSFLALVG